MDSKDLTTGVVWKKLIVFFLPIAAGTIIQQLYNAVDGMIVGKFVSTEALAAVGGSSAQIINLLVGFFVSITAGASVIIAQIFGAGRKEEVGVATGNAIALFGLLGIVLAFFGYKATPWMLGVLKTPADTLELSEEYLRIYFLGVPFCLVYNMESNMMRSVGDSSTPFIIMIAGCIANIILDLVFVLVFDLKVAGVAYATALSQVLSMVAMTAKLMLTKEDYRLHLSEVRLRRTYLGAMLRIGVPSGLQSLMYSVSNMIIQVGVNSLGTVVVASWAMSGKTDGFFWATTNAIGTAITAFIGQNMGAGRYDRMKQCVKDGLVLSFSTTIGLSALLMGLAKPMLHLLTDDPAVVDTTFEIMCYFVPFYFTWSLIEVLSAVLRGAGDAVRPVIIIGLGICAFRVLWVYTAFRTWHTLPVLAASYVISWVITSIALLIYYKKGKWLKRLSVGVTEKEEV